MTLDAPTCTTTCWKVGDTIDLAAHATDAEDGALPGVGLLLARRAPALPRADDCHEHDLLDPTGVDDDLVRRAGPRRRLVPADHRDRHGLRRPDDTATIDVKPKTTPITVKSSPAALPRDARRRDRHRTVGPQDMIVGHSATISAPATQVASASRRTRSARGRTAAPERTP